MLKIVFKEAKMLLANVNVRAEVHGEYREPACDLKFETNVANDRLEEFHPGLKGLLYHFDSSRERDLADQAQTGKQGYAPDLRMPSLELPLKWGEEMLAAKASVKVSGTKSEIELEPVKVNNFQIMPLEGGTVSLSFRIQCHPTEKVFGKLATLVQQEVEVTLTPGEEPAGE